MSLSVKGEEIMKKGLLSMQRRDFVRSSVFTVGGGLLVSSLRALALDAPVPNLSIRRVLAMFKCHFDAGFIDTQANVMRWYFNEYFPQAITAEEVAQIYADLNRRFPNAEIVATNLTEIGSAIEPYRGETLEMHQSLGPFPLQLRRFGY
jgi:hypothetical protein